MSRLLKLYYDQFSEVDAPVSDVVLLHGWGMNSLVWDPLVPLLLKKGYRVTLIELPGFGRSPVPRGQYDLEYLQQLVLEVAPAEAVWIGWSLGGLIASYIAVNAPGRVLGLLAIASSPKFVQEHGNEPESPFVSQEVNEEWIGIPQDEFKRFSDWLDEDWQGSLIRFLALQCKGGATYRNDVRFLKERLFHHGLPARQALKSALDILIETDLRLDLKSLRIPFEFVLGTEDEIVPVASAEQMRSLYGDSSVYLLDGASHMPMLSHANESVSRIEKMVARVHEHAHTAD